MILNDTFKIEFTLDGTDIDLFALGFLSKLKIIEKVSNVVPTLELDLGDLALTDTDAPIIHDGMQIIVTLENLQDGEQTRIPFRVFYYGADAETRPADMVVSCYYDAPDLFKASLFSHIDGRSHEVAKSLAAESKLKFIGDPTSDPQVWIRPGITGGQFLQHVTEHAYKNEKSCYASCVTRLGELRFFNLTSRRAQRSKWLLTQRSEVDSVVDASAVWFTAPVQRSHSGLLNKWRGYGVYASQYNLFTGEKENVYVDKVDKSTSHLNLNSGMAEASRYISGPINCGNTHDNYFKASVQNQQNLALYSSDLQVDVGVHKPITLLDRVDVVSIDDDLSVLSQPLNGSYFVDTVVTVVTSQTVKHRYNLTREGFTTSRNVPDLF